MGCLERLRDHGRMARGAMRRWQTVFPPDVWALLQQLAREDSVTLAAEVRMCVLERARRRGMVREGRKEEED